MNRPTHFPRLLAAAGIAAALAAVVPMPVAQAEPEAPDVPTAVAVPEGNKLFLVGHATGVQIYTCNATSGDPTWVFVAPRADLYGDNGKLIATHFGGPTWQAKDGSYVVAKKDDGVTVDPSAIPWLRLSKVSASAGPSGDRLADTTYIQRTATTGGLAPAAAECNDSTLGTTAEVPYTADYYFWKSAG